MDSPPKHSLTQTVSEFDYQHDFGCTQVAASVARAVQIPEIRQSNLEVDSDALWDSLVIGSASLGAGSLVFDHPFVKRGH